MLSSGLAAVLAAGAAAMPQTLQLNAFQVLTLAGKAQQQGDLVTAEKAYGALAHDADPEVRAEALFRHGVMLSQAGRLAEAAILLRRLLDEKPEATRVRLELARILDLIGDKEAALRELRAAQVAGLPANVARLVDRYSEALRAGRATGASIEIALAPDSNVNRSTRSDTLGTIFGDFDIDEHSKAKSGLGLSLHGQAYRRFKLGSDSSLLVRATTAADLYRRSEFDDIALDLAAGPELKLGGNRVTLELGATQRWFGLKPYLRSVRAAATVVRPLDSRTQLRVGGSAALADYRLNDLQDGKSYSLQASVERALSATTGLALNLSLDRMSANDPGYSTTGWRAGLVGWRDMGRATLTAGAEFGRLRADQRLALFPDNRFDRYSRLTFGATFRQLSFAGFAPVTRVVIERNRSSIALYGYCRRRTEFGLVRAF